MAKERRGHRRRSGPELSTETLQAFAWNFLLAGQRQKYAEPERRLLWKAHRAEILAYQVEHNRRRNLAGYRCSLFWEEVKRAGHKRRPIGRAKDGAKMFETDWLFLRRLGLLVGWEKTAPDPHGHAYDHLRI